MYVVLFCGKGPTFKRMFGHLWAEPYHNRALLQKEQYLCVSFAESARHLRAWGSFGTRAQSTITIEPFCKRALSLYVSFAESALQKSEHQVTFAKEPTIGLFFAKRALFLYVSFAKSALQKSVHQVTMYMYMYTCMYMYICMYMYV